MNEVLAAETRAEGPPFALVIDDGDNVYSVPNLVSRYSLRQAIASVVEDGSPASTARVEFALRFLSPWDRPAAVPWSETDGVYTGGYLLRLAGWSRVE